MLRKFLILLSVFVLAASVTAEPIRTRSTKENRMPEKRQLEIGSLFEGGDSDLGTDALQAVPYARYGLTEDVALTAELPIRNVEQVDGSDNSGIGDLAFGLEFRAWEDIFRAPWIMPYLDLALDTGNDSKGLGEGESSLTGGASIGTTTHNVLHWVADGAYRFNDDSDNQFIGALSLIWDFDEQFSLIGEMQIEETKAPAPEPYSDHPILFLFGFSYEVSERALFTVYGGTQNDGPVEAMGGGKFAWTF